MGCGCKKKKDVARASKTKTAKIVIVEGEVKEVRPPDVLAPPDDVDHLVNKLNDILKNARTIQHSFPHIAITHNEAIACQKPSPKMHLYIIINRQTYASFILKI